MTGFAEIRGGDEQFIWRWEMRAVNGRGLDLRLRLAEGCESLEPELRAMIGKAIKRGSLNVGLRTNRQADEGGGDFDEAAAESGLAAIRRMAELAARAGVEVRPPSVDRLLLLPSVQSARNGSGALDEGRRQLLLADARALVQAMEAARAEEGAVLHAIIATRIEEIERLTGQARECAEARAAGAGALLRERVQALLGAGTPVEEPRLAQELALLAVRTDVTEELDRLEAHVTAARELLSASEPVGRRFDFLTQEFNREANTLCSKAASTDLTRIGLELKTVIDQLREQVQNVE